MLAPCITVAARSRRPRALARSLLALPFALLALSGSARGDDQFTPVFQESACPFQAPGARCGTVEVPERHDSPFGPRIQLQVVQLPSAAAEPAPDPLLMLMGGAGASAIDAFGGLMLSPWGDGIRSRREVVLFDQRGSGASIPSLTCPELVTMVAEHFGEPLSSTQTRALTAQALEECHDRWVGAGVDLSAYNSVESASDVAAVMKALGYTSYNIYGLSYGTILAQHVLRDHPAPIRSVILDSVAPLERNVLSSSPANADRALRLLFSSCAADPSCDAAYPGLEATTLQLIQGLDASPAPIWTTNPYTGSAVMWPLTGQELLGVILGSFNESTLPYLPLVISAMAAGDLSMLQGSSPMWAQQSATYGEAHEYTFRCTEAADFTLEDLETEGVYSPLVTFSTNILSDILDVCEDWNLEPLDRRAGKPVKSHVPAMVLSGQFDITTPPVFAEKMVHDLKRSYLMTFPASGHVVLGPCALQLMADFLENPSASPSNACVQQSPLVFVTP